VFAGVASLLDKSLLQQTEQEGEEPRLMMLETLREFGLEVLEASGEMETTQQAHASFMPAINDLLLGFLLYQSRLVPRVLSLIGIVGAVPLVAGYIAVLFGLLGLHAPLEGLASLPVALFEFSLGVWLVVKGFQPSPILSSDTREAFH
jgi:Domain of unknown function (DUF4386)